jgi:hypothetical protein
MVLGSEWGQVGVSFIDFLKNASFGGVSLGFFHITRLFGWFIIPWIRDHPVRQNDCF